MIELVNGKMSLFALDNPSATKAVLPAGPIRATPQGFSVTTGGNLSNQRKPVMLGTVKLDDTLLTCDQDDFNQLTARSRNRTLVSVTEYFPEADTRDGFVTRS